MGGRANGVCVGRSEGLAVAGVGWGSFTKFNTLWVSGGEGGPQKRRNKTKQERFSFVLHS